MIDSKATQNRLYQVISPTISFISEKCQQFIIYHIKCCIFLTEKSVLSFRHFVFDVFFFFFCWCIFVFFIQRGSSVSNIIYITLYSVEDGIEAKRYVHTLSVQRLFRCSSLYHRIPSTYQQLDKYMKLWICCWCFALPFSVFIHFSFDDSFASFHRRKYCC